MDYHKWHSKWKDLPDTLDEASCILGAQPVQNIGAKSIMEEVFSQEIGNHEPGPAEGKDEFVHLYQQHRRSDEIMNHYVLLDAGDANATGEYFPTGDFRNDVPVYSNGKGTTLSRENQPATSGSKTDSYGWVIGNMYERRPLYGVQTDDLSAPCTGWLCFTAPDPVPTVRYHTDASVARGLKEKGNDAFQEGDWECAEKLYSQSINVVLDVAIYGEAIALVKSNRAEARLRMFRFEAAADDAAEALRLLEKSPDCFLEPVQRLRKKTVVRLAKAQMGCGRLMYAHRMLQDQLRLLPNSKEIQRLHRDVEFAMKLGSSTSLGGQRNEAVDYTSRIIDNLLKHAKQLNSDLRGDVIPEDVAINVAKIENIFSKAQLVQGSLLSELQSLIRTRGGLNSLLQLVQVQRTNFRDGNFVVSDSFKVPAAISLATAVGACCFNCGVNAKIALSEALTFWGLLGGCNRKVDKIACERLVHLAHDLWTGCRPRLLELLQFHGEVVRQAVSFLTRVALGGVNDDTGRGSDAPPLSDGCKQAATSMIYELLSSGGCVEKRALRGVLEEIAGFEGDGLLTSASPAVRALGSLTLQRTLADPALVKPSTISHLFACIRQLLQSGPHQDQGSVSVPFPDYGDDVVMCFADLHSFAETEKGRSVALALEVISRTLQFRFASNRQELNRDSFEDSFCDCNGLFLIIPLLTAPRPFAEPALRCLATWTKARNDASAHIAALGGIKALLDMPVHCDFREKSCMQDLVVSSPSARGYAARILSRCIDTEVAMDLFQGPDQRSIRALSKLILKAHQDGNANLNSLHELVHVLFVVSSYHPGHLCANMPEDLVRVLVDVSLHMQHMELASLADAVLQIVRTSSSSRKLIRSIREAHTSSYYDVATGDLLKLQRGPILLSASTR